jgi:hypothetical protein
MSTNTFQKKTVAQKRADREEREKKQKEEALRKRAEGGSKRDDEIPQLPKQKKIQQDDETLKSFNRFAVLSKK